MSARKGRGAKVLTVPPEQSQKASSFHHTDSPDLSAIDQTSFLEGLHQNYGPLHSTAVEEGLEEGQVDKGRAGRGDIPKTVKTTGKQRGVAVKRKTVGSDGENKKEEERKRSRKSAGDKVKTRPVKNQQMEDKKRKSESSTGKSGDRQSEESDSDTAHRSRRRVLSSDEDLDEDTSWKPSPKKARMHRLDRTRKSSSDVPKSRKSSSGSGSGEAEKASSDEQRRMRRGHQGGTESEVVLDAFLDFCEQYRESVESKAVKQTIDYFSNDVKDQLLEKISSRKVIKGLKRENAKVGSLIRKKTQRLLDAKQELMRAERQVWLLQKDKAELELRLADLRRGHAFLRDIRELNRQYLGYRHKHPEEKETYGASSLPALLLETKHVQPAEH